MKPGSRGFALLSLAFVLKLIVLLQLRDHPLTHPDAGLDTTACVELAKQVLAGNVGLGPGVYYVATRSDTRRPRAWRASGGR